MGSIIIISLALALGTYGIAAQRGANLVKLDRYILLMSALWGIMELAAAFAGYGAGRWRAQSLLGPCTGRCAYGSGRTADAPAGFQKEISI